MSSFSYKKPDERRYFETVVKILEDKKKGLATKLNSGKCTISSSSTFSGKRWDAMKTTIYFYVPIEIINKIDESDKTLLLDVCDMIMPKEIGFDVTDIEIGPILDSISDNRSLQNDLEEIISNESFTVVQTLPKDVKIKGQKMAEVYSYLYCIENTLRLFIEQIGSARYGEQYFDQLSISKSVKRKIEQRKKEEEMNQWLCIRGDSDLFYLDFKELGDIIVNNWNDFKNYFPDQSFINSKINELARCRNLIAHNSMITTAEKDLLRLYFNQILSQINGTRHE